MVVDAEHRHDLRRLIDAVDDEKWGVGHPRLVEVAARVLRAGVGRMPGERAVDLGVDPGKCSLGDFWSEVLDAVGKAMCDMLASASGKDDIH